MTKYFVQTVGPIDLDQRHFKAKGGEKSIFIKGKTAYAIYHDAANMIPSAKIKELAALDHPDIFGPKLLILDSKNVPIGYTMRALPNCSPLVTIFPKTFKQNHGISPETVLALIKKGQSLTSFIHQHKCLIIDFNELNFLTDEKFKEWLAIDINSYATPHYPATVIMPHIRDRHTNGFNEGTDWFSFGILAFTLLIGMHPYRGGHPDFANVPLDERLDARMQANVSAFHDKATMPAAALPLDIIPKGLKRWFIDVLEKKERRAPPTDYETAVQVVAAVVKEITGSNLFTMKEIANFARPVLRVWANGTKRVVQTEGYLYYGSHEFGCENDALIGFTPQYNHPIKLTEENGEAIVTEVKTQNVLYRCASDGIMSYDGRLYIQTGVQLFEVEFIELPTQLAVSLRSVANVIDLPEATRIFDGVIVQNLLGRCVVSVLPQSKVCYQIPIPELDHYRLIDAKFQNKVLMMVGEKRGRYDRFVFRFDDGYSAYDCRVIKDIQYAGLNFTVADHGTCVMIDEEDRVEVFMNKKDAPVKVFTDPAIESDMTLFHDGTAVLLARGKKLYSFSKRK
jgi:hypothetical protein